MTKPHRIAAGGIIIRDGAILLVRYRDSDGSDYLVGPGGALEETENAIEAIVRETMEETAVTVRPYKVIAIEDLMCSRFKMCKIWMLCDVTSGYVQRTEGAKREGIVEADWFTRDQLAGEVVYPPFVKSHDWNSFFENDWQVLCLQSREASF
jgi:8-oxo-dGTP diphosphatase